MAAESSAAGKPRNTAIKDAQLTYRACTLGYANSLQLASPAQLVGQTDVDFLSDRAAALVRAADLRVLETGKPEVTSGEVLSKRTAGKFFVRHPVLNRSGEICGIEIFVVSLTELHHSYQSLLSSELQLREVISHAPYGLLIHQNYELVFVNQSWLELMANNGAAPSEEEIRHLIPTLPANDSHAIRSIDTDGVQTSLRLHTSAVRWNGSDAQAVYCVPVVQGESVDSVLAAKNDAGFVEKRFGHRRGSAIPETESSPTPAAGLLSMYELPMLICDGWRPIQSNTAAEALLKSESGERLQSISHWFTDRQRAGVEAMLNKVQASDELVAGRVQCGDRHFFCHVRVVTKAERALAVVSLQPATEVPSETDLSVNKLRDFVSAAGDFLWEMNSNRELTHVSVEMNDFLGVQTGQLLNVPLDTLVERYVHEDDVPEWKVLLVDMAKRLPFRNREYKWLHKDGDKRVVRLSGVPVFDSQDRFTGYRGIGWDYTAQHHSASIVAYHASHDSLTGLVNRREFELRCNEAVSRAAQANQALCFIDLDNFKRVNDTAGHLAGDELLRQLSALFSSLVRRSDVLARLGGDEFALLIYDVGLAEGMRLANQLRSEVESFRFLWEGKQFSVGASIGLVIVDERWDTRSALFAAADAACYEAKNKGRNRVAVYQQATLAEDNRHEDAQWDEYIKGAIVERRIKLALQRIKSPDETADTTSKVEVLMRMPSPQGELLQPGAVFPLAERFGLSVQLDKAIVSAVFDWLEGQPHVSDKLELCCINLSAASLNDQEFHSYLVDAVQKLSIDASILCFEVNESAVSTALTSVASMMEKLGALGCKFAIDDFSGGLNSFSYLKKLPVNFVKINGELVRAILEDPLHYAMVKSINDVVKTLGKQTIAGSVESDAVLAKLQELDVSLVQGYHVSAPEIIDY